ncbi:hypothetical protein [Bradyrhizobium liaoningense]|uniref:hypothetical protein n=1 Tax=Bradyrhizobium liaoningense TaxID=43992 RepID=UPI0004B3535D|nr:hypothetical protein [Bradyrhizobium liaoningense]
MPSRRIASSRRTWDPTNSPDALDEIADYGGPDLAEANRRGPDLDGAWEPPDENTSGSTMRATTPASQTP